MRIRFLFPNNTLPLNDLLNEAYQGIWFPVTQLLILIIMLILCRIDSHDYCSKRNIRNFQIVIITFLMIFIWKILYLLVYLYFSIPVPQFSLSKFQIFRISNLNTIIEINTRGQGNRVEVNMDHETRNCMRMKFVTRENRQSPLSEQNQRTLIN